jgi:hypothetical protein
MKESWKQIDAARHVSAGTSLNDVIDVFGNPKRIPISRLTEMEKGGGYEMAIESRDLPERILLFYDSAMSKLNRSGMRFNFDAPPNEVGLKSRMVALEKILTANEILVIAARDGLVTSIAANESIPVELDRRWIEKVENETELCVFDASQFVPRGHGCVWVMVCTNGEIVANLGFRNPMLVK